MYSIHHVISGGMRMNRITHRRDIFMLLAVTGIVLFTSAPTVAVNTVSIDQPGTYTISAGINEGCMQSPVYFTIASGLVAKDFKVSSIDSGYNCMTGAPSDLKGFEIESDGVDIHSETIYNDRPPDVYYQPLMKLNLQSGNYSLYAYGGRSAYVVLEMTVESALSTPSPGSPSGGTTVPSPGSPGGTTTPTPGIPGGTTPPTPGTPSGGITAPVATTFDGTWNTDWWGRLNLTVSGNTVSGTYEESAGRVSGTLSADGKTIDGWWSEAPDYDPPACAGRFELTLSADAQSLTGWFIFGNYTKDYFDITGSRAQ